MESHPQQSAYTPAQMLGQSPLTTETTHADRSNPRIGMSARQMDPPSKAVSLGIQYPNNLSVGNSLPTKKKNFTANLNPAAAGQWQSIGNESVSQIPKASVTYPNTAQIPTIR